MNFHRARFPAAALLLLVAAAACGTPVRKQRQYCPAGPHATVVKDTVVMRAAPGQGRMGRHLQVSLLLPAQRPDLKDLRLFIDGHPVPGVSGKQIGARCALRNGDTVTGYRETYEFVPVRNAESKDTWAHLLGSPAAFVDSVQVGAGLPTGGAFNTNPVPDSTLVAFTVVDETMFWVTTTLFLALLALLVWAGIRTSILRDPTPVEPPGDNPGPDPRDPRAAAAQPARESAAAGNAPYSLAKVVMAMWTFLVLGGFFAIWLITGDHQGIFTPQVLLLLGITGVSTAVSVALTNQKNQPLAQEGRELRMQASALRHHARVMEAQAQAQAAGFADEHAKLLRDAEQSRDAAERVESALAVVRSESPVSHGLFQDILSDANGPALYRFQNLLWNVALALVFVIGTYRALSFPHFDESLMVLLGISEGLYLGVKITSPRKSAGSGDQPAQPARWAHRPIPS